MTTLPLLPAYFHPAASPLEWAKVRRLGDCLGGVVVNVADGPGERSDAAYSELIADLGPRVRLLGYVDVAYGRRPANEVLGHAVAWQDRYAVDHVFLDQCPPSLTPGLRRLILILRNMGAGSVTANPGLEPDQRLLDMLDACVTFEGDWRAYADPLRNWPRQSDERSLRLHLVHGVPLAEHAAAHAIADRTGAGCYVTDGIGVNPWDHVSPSLGNQLVGAK